MFKKRRLYANLNRDSVVPLGTGSFMHQDEVVALRQRFRNQYGIVYSTISSNSTQMKSGSCSAKEDFIQQIVSSLDATGWEKVIVNFAGVYPLAHNKICALTRSPHWLYDELLGFKEGEFVMSNASEWLCNNFA